jgi:lipid A 3-O-deacylase
MIRRIWLFRMAMFAITPAAMAQTLTLQHDNDEWGGGGTDWEYSQGTRLTFTSPGLAETGIAKSVTRILPGVSPDARLSAGVGAGSAYYEPRFLFLTTPIPDQRPYAGWLYGEALLNAETGNHLTSWRLDLGVVGPSAQGEEITKFFHNVFSGYDQLGWDNQIRDRVGLNISTERRWRNIVGLTGDIGLDISPALGVELGTVSDAVNAGLMLRLGGGLENDFGPPRVGAFSGSLEHGGDDVSIYAFASAIGSWVPYDVFLDEPGGRENDPVRAGEAITREDTRGQFSLGLVAAWGRARATFAMTEAGKTYDQQADTERFAEMNLSYRF